MAVAHMTKSALRLVFYTGDDLISGKPIYKTKSFNNVKTEATADQLFEIATAFAGLQQHSLFNIERADNSEIRNGDE